MQERFKQLLEEKGLTATKFASVIKVNASAMSHILNGRSKPGFDVLDKIVLAFPDINLNWLVSGQGSMFGHSAGSRIPTQKSLFPDDTEPEDSPVQAPAGKKDMSAMSAEVAVAKALGQTTRRNVKRIVLFFEDGGFEDYSNL